MISLPLKKLRDTTTPTNEYYLAILFSPLTLTFGKANKKVVEIRVSRKSGIRIIVEVEVDD